MTYSKKYGNYGIYTDGMLYKWFKNKKNAMDFWNNDIVPDPETAVEWLEEYDSVKLVNMKTGELIKAIGEI